jgi:hypothetical protein
MSIRDGSLGELETLVWGYYTGLHNHGLIELVPEMTRHFSTWLYHETGWSTACGWAYAITSNRTDSSDSSPLDEFFGFVDRYRRLRSVTRSARLGRNNRPTGKRVVIGMAGRMDRPASVDIVRYAPTRLHFLRFNYRGRTVNDSILMTGNGSHDTSLRFAKQWMADEFETRDSDWHA